MASLMYFSSSSLFVSVLLGSLSTLAFAIPSPQSLNSDLTILLHNDLYGNTSRNQDAVIVLSTPQTLLEAQKSCAAIGETIWAPLRRGLDINTDADFLNYLGYGRSANSSNQLYWIEGYGLGTDPPGTFCDAIAPDTIIYTVDCGARYPVLCTHSADLSTPNNANTSTQWQTSVTSGNQIFTGYRDKLSFRFLGIRYASKPTRFTYSEPYNKPGNASALTLPPKCIQADCTNQTCSEDCLFLNIWTPYLRSPSNTTNTTFFKKRASATPNNLKAVMLWIHGGGFVNGYGSDPTVDGGNMASRGDVVVVTINYRLSTLGFLALSNTSTPLNGNFGLADQMTALQWLRDHVSAFGGDPHRITVFGQSAGAASVRALLASPKAKGLFTAAVMMSNLAGSNYAGSFSKYYTIGQEMDVTGSKVLKETGCKDVECLRGFDAVKLVELGTVASNIVVDGTYITSPNLPLNVTQTPKIPVMMGIMRDDGAAFVSYPTTSNTSQALTAASFNASSIVTSNAFPAPQGSNTTLNAFNVTARVATDAEFRCLDQATAYAAVKNGVWENVWFYEFQRSYQLKEWSPNPPTCSPPVTEVRPNGDTEQEYFKCHSGELYYVFGTLTRQGLPLRDDLDIPFNQYILDTWTAFGRTHNPNPDPAYLSARNYVNSTDFVTQAGTWNSVKTYEPMMRTLQAPMKVEEAFNEAKQCKVLGYPLDYYL